MTSSPSPYKLSEHRHESVYRRLERFSFLDTTPQESPSAVILGGQPGAGKSKLLDHSYQEFPGQNAVRINGDDFRQWHPHIQDILENDEANMAAHTDPDVRAWTKRLFDTAIETKRNVIFEGTMRVKHDISNTMQRLREDGYHVTARVIAAHERQSITGIHTRFETQKIESGHGRMAPIAVHDQAYLGMLETIENIETNALADKIQVFNRAGEIVHEAQLVGDSWDNPGARAAIETERRKTPSVEDCRTYIRDWAHVFDLMEERGADISEISSVREIASIYIAEIYPILAAQQDMTLRVMDIQMADAVSGKSFQPMEVSQTIEIDKKPVLNKERDHDAGPGMK